MVRTLEGMLGELAGDVEYANKVMTKLNAMCDENCDKCPHVNTKEGQKLLLLLENVNRKIDEDVGNLTDNEEFEGDCGIHTLAEVRGGMRRTVAALLATRIEGH